MEDFAVIPAVAGLVPGGPPSRLDGIPVRLPVRSHADRSPRAFGLGVLQTPPRGDALALLLAFGSAITWREDFHLGRSVPCLAHTLRISRGAKRRRLQARVMRPDITAAHGIHLQ